MKPEERETKEAGATHNEHSDQVIQISDESIHIVISYDSTQSCHMALPLRFLHSQQYSHSASYYSILTIYINPNAVACPTIPPIPRHRSSGFSENPAHKKEPLATPHLLSSLPATVLSPEIAVVFILPFWYKYDRLLLTVT